jgi:hypothetical protein
MRPLENVQLSTPLQSKWKSDQVNPELFVIFQPLYATPTSRLRPTGLRSLNVIDGTFNALAEEPLNAMTLAERIDNVNHFF